MVGRACGEARKIQARRKGGGREEVIGTALERAARSLTRLRDGLRNKLEIWHNTRVWARAHANFYRFQPDPSATLHVSFAS